MEIYSMQTEMLIAQSGGSAGGTIPGGNEGSTEEGFGKSTSNIW